VLERRDRAGSELSQPPVGRVLAGTVRDLGAEVARGRFLRDLYDRLTLIHLHLPALRERLDDVPALAAHLLATSDLAARKQIRGIDRAALARLAAHRWPGNVRELQAVLERAVDRAAAPTLSAADLSADLGEQPLAGGICIPGWTLDQLERHAILEALQAAGGSTSRAARALGISVRNVQYKLRDYRQGGADAPDLRVPVRSREKVA
jgi:two-component system NtrC family response regulator